MAVDEKMLREVTAYIQRWDAHLELYFGGRFALEDKRLLVVGSGWGTEVLWALKQGAAYVAGIDPRSAERAFVETALAEHGLSHLASRFTLHQGSTPTVPDLGSFDLALSNNTFEHVECLSPTWPRWRASCPTRADVSSSSPIRFSIRLKGITCRSAHGSI